MKGFTKRRLRKDGSLTTTNTTGRIYSGVSISTGERLDIRTLNTRVTILSQIINEMVSEMLPTLWNDTMFDKFATLGTDGYAAKAVEKVFGLPQPPPPIHCSSRIRRMAGDIVGRELRIALHEHTLYSDMIRVCVGTLEWKDAVGTSIEKRNTKRSLSKHERANGKPVTSYFSVAPTPPQLTPTIPLSAVDEQQVLWVEPKGNRLILRVLLPTIPAPTKTDWEWCDLTISVDSHIFAQYLAGRVLLTLPNLKIVDGKLLAHITIDSIPQQTVLNPDVMLGLDWGVNKLLSGAFVVRSPDGQLTTSGHLLVFNAASWHKKDHDRRIRTEFLYKKIDHNEKLVEGKPNEQLCTKILAWRVEAEHISKARRESNIELCRLAARWAVEQALMCGAKTIVIENLDSLEPKFDKHKRVALSQRVRGMLRTALHTACKKAGITFIEVDPANTSKICHQCGGMVKYVKASNDSRKGYSWAYCVGCEKGWDRDHNAAINIATRELNNPGTGKKHKKLGHIHGNSHNDLGGVVHKRIKKAKKVPPPRTSIVYNPQHPSHPLNQPQRLPNDNNSIVENTQDATATNSGSRSALAVRARRRVHRSVIPPQPGRRSKVVSVVYRSAGPDTQQTSDGKAVVGMQFGNLPLGSTFSTKQPLTLRSQVRTLDGMRYAHRHRIRMSPVREPHQNILVPTLVGSSNIS